ncbi:MAG: AAA family ATPase [Prevotella sp.]|nr:AAA family ATPase [Prevotella sp.]
MAVENIELRRAWDFVENTGTSVFITGKAGTGKTTFLKTLKEHSSKRMVVVAPTGVAAINAGGVTIHSFFQLPLSPYVPNTSYKSKYDFSQEKRNIINTLDLLVIDEISMVRSDLLDAIDNVLRRFRQHDLPFGGVQLLMIGDLQQLAPVVTEQDAQLLNPYYDTPFFFGSKALSMIHYVTIELKHVYRQTDYHFISLLNAIRDGNVRDEVISELNQRYIKDFHPEPNEGYIRLTTHNSIAQKYNDKELSEIKQPVRNFEATIEGNFPEYSYPTDVTLSLKVGAQVMFIKNDSSLNRQFYNGKIGHVVGFEDEEIIVRCPDDDFDIKVSPMNWENVKYVLNDKTKEIDSEVQGVFTQYPLRLAWAITIHKSQGLTFEKTIIDAAMSFASGQVYVALSRCKSLEGLVLASPLSRHAIIRDQRVNNYISHQEIEAQQSIALLPQLKEDYYRSMLLALFDFSDLLAKEEWYFRVINEYLYRQMPTLLEEHKQLIDAIKVEIIEVSEKWKSVLASTQSNTFASDAFKLRIAKGIDYFLSHLSSTYGKTSILFKIDVDNKFNKTRIENAMTDLALSYYGKVGLLKMLDANGFTIANYMKYKNVAVLNAADEMKSQMSAQNKRRRRQGVEVKHWEVYRKLSTWRDNFSEFMDISPSAILQQKAMINIANDLPCTLSALKKVQGVGRKTIDRYSDDILKIVREYVLDLKKSEK